MLLYYIAPHRPLLDFFIQESKHFISWFEKARDLVVAEKIAEHPYHPHFIRFCFIHTVL